MSSKKVRRKETIKNEKKNEARELDLQILWPENTTRKIKQNYKICAYVFEMTNQFILGKYNKWKQMGKVSK